MISKSLVLCLVFVVCVVSMFDSAVAAEPTYIFREAEDFDVVKGDWEAKPWGTNYYAATAANTFLSRLAYLGGSEQGKSVAVTEIDVPVADDYLVLCRYEAVYQYETQFGIKIKQNGKVVFDRLYGARANPKIWFFGKYFGEKKTVQPEMRLGWGPVENIVWEGHTNKVKLQPGKVTVTLYKGKQATPAAKRNIDILMITNDEKEVLHRVENEAYLPLDGLMTQEGSLYLKVKNDADSPVPMLFGAVVGFYEHSPYWIHPRNWKSKTIGKGGVVIEGNPGGIPWAEVAKVEDDKWLQPGQESSWVEIGSGFDSLNDSGWTPSSIAKGVMNIKDGPAPKYTLTFAVPGDDGELEVIRVMEGMTDRKPMFAMSGNVAGKKEILLGPELAEKVADMIRSFPKKGKKPELISFYPAKAFYPFGEVYRDALGLNTDYFRDENGEIIGSDYLHLGWRVRGEALEKKLKELVDKGMADKVKYVCLGDEGAPGIAAPYPGSHERFREWLKGQGLKPSDIVPDATDWESIEMDPEIVRFVREGFGQYRIECWETDNPKLYYYSGIFGAKENRDISFKTVTDRCREVLPNALISANNTPHIAFYWPLVREAVKPFREEAMTMPWGEDYVYQVPVTSTQVFGFLMEGHRAGARTHNQRMYTYLMPQCPGNRDDNFRRLFYTDIAYGNTIFNLFTLDPPAIEYSENNVHQDCEEMFRAMYDVIHETGLFEDIVYPGKVRDGEVAMLLSESSELWYGTNIFNSEKQHIWMALKGAQVPVNFVIEEDVIDGYLDDYKVLYIADPCINEKASAALVEWVKNGGQLFAVAGAGTQNEFAQANATMMKLYGINPKKLELEDLGDEVAFFGKEHLPWLDPMDHVKLSFFKKLPVMIGQQKFELAKPETFYSDIVKFKSGGPAMVTRQVGKGTVTYAGFFPGMAYVKPAIPQLPCDRSSAPDAFSHFTPYDFDKAAKKLILEPVKRANVDIPIESSVPLVEVAWIESADGIAVPLVYWHEEKKAENVEIRIKKPGKISKVELASERPVEWRYDGDDVVAKLDLEIADLIMLRR